MSYKVLPIWNYKFTNVQNQYFKINTVSNKVEMIDFIGLENITTGITENDYFTDEPTPTINVASVGSLNIDFKFSMNMIAPTYLSSLSSYHSIEKISMFIFFDSGTNKKYYYIVEDCILDNASIYTFNLTLDVIKTYFETILKINDVEPIRYFEPVSTHFDFSKMTNYDHNDPLLFQNNNASFKINLAQFVRNHHFDLTLGRIYDDFHYSGIWSYFYMTYESSDDDSMKALTRFKNEDYFIVAFPKNPKSLSDRLIYRKLKGSPALLKVIDSVVSPFGKDKNFQTGIKEIVCKTETLSNGKTYTDFSIKIDEVDPLLPVLQYIDLYDSTDSEETIYSIPNCSYNTGTSAFENNPYIPNSLITHLGLDTPSLANLKHLIFIRDNIKLSDSVTPLIPLVDKVDYVSNYLSRYSTPNTNLCFPYDSFITQLKNYGEFNNAGVGTVNNVKEINQMFETMEIGFANSNKMNINKKKLFQVKSGSSIITYSPIFETRILHSLQETIEEIRYYSSPDVEDSEIFIQRNCELKSSRVTDTYYNYVYQNQNSIATKEYQLKKFNTQMNTMNAIVSGVGIIAGVGLGIATGGVGLGVVGAIGSGFGVGYNTLKNHLNNQIQIKAFESEMQDKKNTPLIFDSSNYNDSKDDEYYLPILVIYRYSPLIEKDYTKYSTFAVDNEEIYRLIRKFGYYTPNKKVANIESLFTREEYNFIQLKNTDFLNYRFDESDYIYTIPNTHFELIKKIFENGVSFRTPLYNENMQNKERS